MHTKHAKLARPDTGTWGKWEWAILGTSCGTIRTLAEALARQLLPHWQTGYADADHAEANSSGPPSLPFAVQYTDKTGFQRFDALAPLHQYEGRWQMRPVDVVLVNGNHFTARKQILVLNRRKFDSLSRKLDRLTQVDLLLTERGHPDSVSPEEMPDFLKAHLPRWQQIPVMDIAEHAAIARHLSQSLQPPPVRGLILAGGHSMRMGQDKSRMVYHGQPQWQHLRQVLQTAGVSDVYVSCRAGQADQFEGVPTITDTFLDLGPFGAILSAFRAAPDAAWLVAACDLPLADAAALAFLLEHRCPSAGATAFRQPVPPEGWTAPPGETGFPEPLLAIWEPKQYGFMLMMLAQGISCPRKVLLQGHTCLLDAPRPQVLLNVNTPEENAQMLQWMKQRVP
jgi:molybdopterin-guanine dinucleotide biosynthesis protein A